MFNTGHRGAVRYGQEILNANYVWDTNILDWVAMTQPTSGGGAGGDVNVTNSSVPVSQVGSWSFTSADLTSIAGAIKGQDAASGATPSGIYVLGRRSDSDVSVVDADGDVAPFAIDEVGRLKVATTPASLAPVTGNITVNGGTVSANVERASNVVITLVATSLVGHTSLFEFSNNSTNGVDGTWYAFQVIRTNANTIELNTGVLAATPAYGWEASVNGYKYIRIRASAHTSGTATYTIRPGSYATEPIPAAQVSATQSVNGTVVANAATPNVSSLNSAATTNSAVIKASAGQVWSGSISNISASTRYVKLYNAASITVGTTVPVCVIPVPATSCVQLNFPTTGLRFSTGICMAITGGIADTDTTAIGAGEVKTFFNYS